MYQCTQRSNLARLPGEKKTTAKMGGTPENLAIMNLKLKNINDECLGYAGWRRKEVIHTLAKANTYQANKPMDDGDWWGYNPPTAANSCQAPRGPFPQICTMHFIRVKNRKNDFTNPAMGFLKLIHNTY